MSKWTMESVKCPVCGKDSTFKVWSVVNADRDPKMKAKVLSEEMFTLKCPECGNESYTNYGFIYRQLKGNLLLAYGADRENFDDLVREAFGEDPDAQKEIEDSRKRIVSSMNEMKEKIMIADENFDDRVIEMIKLIFVGRLQESRPDMLFDEIRFDQDPEGYHLVILQKNEPLGAVDFTEELYELTAMEYEEELNAAEDELIIDPDWAYAVMSED